MCRGSVRNAKIRSCATWATARRRWRRRCTPALPMRAPRVWTSTPPVRVRPTNVSSTISSTARPISSWAHRWSQRAWTSTACAWWASSMPTRHSTCPTSVPTNGPTRCSRRWQDAQDGAGDAALSSCKRAKPNSRSSSRSWRATTRPCIARRRPSGERLAIRRTHALYIYT